MSKRIYFGFFSLACVLGGWLVGQVPLTRAAAQPGNASSSSDSAKFQLYAKFIGDVYQAWRLDKNTGEAFQEVADNKLARIKDPGAIPTGDYELSMIANGKVYMVHRLDRKTGRMWKVSGADWVELTAQK